MRVGKLNHRYKRNHKRGGGGEAGQNWWTPWKLRWGESDYDIVDVRNKNGPIRITDAELAGIHGMPLSRLAFSWRREEPVPHRSLMQSGLPTPTASCTLHESKMANKQLESFQGVCQNYCYKRFSEYWGTSETTNKTHVAARIAGGIVLQILRNISDHLGLV